MLKQTSTTSILALGLLLSACGGGSSSAGAGEASASNNGSGGSHLYENCDEARAAGAAPIAVDEPGYRPALDADSDGIACEEDERSGNSTSGNPTTVSGVYYKNCTEARQAGAAPIYRGEPGYRPGLDRDNDGIACE